MGLCNALCKMQLLNISTNFPSIYLEYIRSAYLPPHSRNHVCECEEEGEDMQAQPGWVDIAVVHNWEGRGRWGARGRVWDGVKGE